MKKIYKLLVDGEVIPFEAISIDENGTATSENNNPKMFAYENNPMIVDISGMIEIPGLDAVYNQSPSGTSFVGNLSQVPANLKNHGKFALIVNNLVKLVIMFDLGTELGSKMNAVFASSPQFLEPEIAE
jgi:hypothetical protein